MPSKIKTITLSSGWVNLPPNPNTTAVAAAQADGYRVEKVTDSVEYTPGQMLHRNEVHTLCTNAYWRVTVVAYKPKGD